MIGEHTITLQLRPGQTKNGDWVYRRDGVRASIYINQRIFKRGTVPETITLSSSEGDVNRLRNNLDPEATTRRIEHLRHRAQRKREIASDALTQADAMREKVDALSASLDDFEG